MTTPNNGGCVWPVRLAYFAALILTLASGGTNLIYGWNKGTDLPSSVVWAAVSIGVSILFALSWPAFILAFLTERGGVLASSQLHIGRALGWSKTWTHEVLHDLADAGLVKLTTGRTGTVVQLARGVA